MSLLNKPKAVFITDLFYASSYLGKDTNERKKGNINFLAKRYLRSEDSSFKVGEPRVRKNHHKYGKTISVVIHRFDHICLVKT